jgi:hypothetical protein
MSSIMRWRSGLTASVPMGTLLSEVDDASILERAHGPPSLFFQTLSVLTAKPSAISGLSRSDLVHWRNAEVAECAPHFRYSDQTGQIRHSSKTSRLTQSGHQAHGTRGAKRSGNRGAPCKIEVLLSDWPDANPHEIEDRFRHGFAAHLIEARFLQKFSRLLVPPKSVVKLVESTKTISPARCSFGAIQRRQLNSVFPAAVNGCGRSRSIG